MKIKRKGNRVEIRRNKKRGLKLKIMETPELTGQACRNCLFWENTTGICSDKVEKNLLDPCDKLGLNQRNYFAHED